ncbi:Aste57867_6948 [Aphanomyces stellatus]|uniref:Aste57867_6948 protein n=1 Tax=Aphanomyces stellatus TaxID=120398 RepID=A0A485KFA4_9STRA|nr:hypothetical protein As57867_006926 [Aphanomyces stellatus]VFT83900.1 Aste57867_6948 [Aphanomyces stellatus]
MSLPSPRRRPSSSLRCLVVCLLVFMPSIVVVDAAIVSCAGQNCSCPSAAYTCTYDLSASTCACDFKIGITIGLCVAVVVFGGFWYSRARRMRHRKNQILKAKSTAQIVQMRREGGGGPSVQAINPASKWSNQALPPQGVGHPSFNSIVPQK